MKNRMTKQRLQELAGIIREGRVPFKGTKTDQLYRIVKDKEDAMIFANGKLYAVDAEMMKSDLQNPVVLAVDEDGEEVDINVSDIEFIEL